MHLNCEILTFCTLSSTSLMRSLQQRCYEVVVRSWGSLHDVYSSQPQQNLENVWYHSASQGLYGRKKPVYCCHTSVLSAAMWTLGGVRTSFQSIKVQMRIQMCCWLCFQSTLFALSTGIGRDPTSIDKLINIPKVERPSIRHGSYLDIVAVLWVCLLRAHTPYIMQWTDLYVLWLSSPFLTCVGSLLCLLASYCHQLSINVKAWSHHRLKRQTFCVKIS